MDFDYSDLAYSEFFKLTNLFLLAFAAVRDSAIYFVHVQV